jgi:hypothetical protein
MANRVDRKKHQASVKAIGARFRQYLDHVWHGNQSALAKAIAVSQPPISRVTTGEQLPSGILLLALRERTNLNLDWLLSEHGQMLLVDGIGSPTVPVADRPLPGPPSSHLSLLSGDLVAGFGSVRPTQYWLRVQKNDAILHSAYWKIKAGDLLLFDTDRSVFPEPDRVENELWIARHEKRGECSYKLAEVSNIDGVLLADTFEMDVERSAYEEVIEIRKRDGEYEASISVRPSKKKVRLQPRSPEWLPNEHRVTFDDLVARKLVLLRR